MLFSLSYYHSNSFSWFLFTLLHFFFSLCPLTVLFPYSSPQLFRSFSFFSSLSTWLFFFFSPSSSFPATSPPLLLSFFISFTTTFPLPHFSNSYLSSSLSLYLLSIIHPSYVFPLSLFALPAIPLLSSFYPPRPISSAHSVPELISILHLFSSFFLYSPF